MPSPRSTLWPAALLVVLAACGGGGGGGNGRTVKVVGRLPAPGLASGLARSRASAAAALSVSDATKVIVLGTTGAISVKAVTGGAFDFDTDAGKPVGVVFAGPADQYLGYLAVRGTIPALPLQGLPPGVERVDLGTLVANGTVLAPGIDPIGSTISLSDAEIAALSEMGFVFRMIVAWPDVDGDGAVDWLQGRMYSPQVALHRTGTISALQADPPGPVTAWRFGYNVADRSATTYPSSATISGPPGSGIAGMSCPAQLGPYQNAYYGLLQGQAGVAPPAGVWTSAYAGRTLTFQMPDASGLAAAAPYLVPTVTLDASQSVKSISWRWQYPDGTAAATAPRLADSVTIQIRANPGVPTCAASNVALGPGQVYAMQLPPDGTEHTLACQNIPWQSVTGLSAIYIDVFNTFHDAYYARP